MWSRFILITLSCSVVFLAQFGDAATAVDHSRSKRDENNYVVEMVVAVDQGMIEHYGDDLDDVIKSSVYLQSLVYERSNLKQKVSLSLAEIVRLPFEPSEDADSPGAKDGGKNGGTMLGKFCDYVEGNSSIKYDTAMYITR